MCTLRRSGVVGFLRVAGVDEDIKFGEGALLCFMQINRTFGFVFYQACRGRHAPFHRDRNRQDRKPIGFLYRLADVSASNSHCRYRPTLSSRE